MIGDVWRCFNQGTGRRQGGRTRFPGVIDMELGDQVGSVGKIVRRLPGVFRRGIFLAIWTDLGRIQVEKDVQGHVQGRVFGDDLWLGLKLPATRDL